ncbi:piggyBac transposable element-derived protein 3-like [Sycon ciliatum]|uniref:piggyBac transposable element-derived protein 3-like n=1 Tax=Sycon ciliatum TaxID=27933 RepID=UPI0031F62A8A
MADGAFYGRRVLPKRTSRIVTLLEAEEAVENSDQPENLVILPPSTGDANVDSDVEDGRDDLLDDDHIMEPAGEMELDEYESEDEDYEVHGSDDSEDEGSGEPAAKRTPAGATRWMKRTAFDTILPEMELPSFIDDHPELITASPMDLWRGIYTPALIEKIVDQSLLYAAREKNNDSFGLEAVDLERFLGILLLSGYHTLPTESDYWSTQPDLGVPLVQTAMSRNRFRSIKQYLHFVDNQALQEGNKVAKVAPLYDSLNEQLVKWNIFHPLLSIDESMVPYFGKHSAKMFIKGKPIRFGYKIWCLCGSDGFPYHLQIYTGRQEGRPVSPLGLRVVGDMVDVIRVHSDTRCHELFFDNFFTSYSLLEILAEKNMRAVGTVRDNRTGGANQRLVSTKELKKKARGTFDYRCNGTVFICKWNDNSVVNAASNYATHEPLATVKRRVKNVSNTTVTQPHLIQLYNKGMGGVDLFDRLLGSYRPRISGKKWYWALFVNHLNATVVAAWRLHCKVHEKPMSHIEFRREITVSLLKTDLRPEPRVSGLPVDVRYDGVGHTRESTTQGRCKVCKRNTRCKCSKCGVRLHFDHGANCNELYHTR